MTTLLNKTDSDLNAALYNMSLAWIFGNTANIISNSLFHFNLNQYNSVTHFVEGVGIGTYVYRKSGRGVKGLLTALIVNGICNGVWECFENKYVFHSDFKNMQAIIDTTSDFVVASIGSVLGPLSENYKERTSLKLPKGKEKWVL